jgi:hypothetical protein
MGHAAVHGLISGHSTSAYAPTRLRAARRLGELGGRARAALPALKSKLDDPDPKVREAVGGAIAIIEGTPPFERECECRKNLPAGLPQPRA